MHIILQFETTCVCLLSILSAVILLVTLLSSKIEILNNLLYNDSIYAFILYFEPFGINVVFIIVGPAFLFILFIPIDFLI